VYICNKWDRETDRVREREREREERVWARIVLPTNDKLLSHALSLFDSLTSGNLVTN